MQSRRQRKTAAHGRHDYHMAIHLVCVRGYPGGSIFFPAQEAHTARAVPLESPPELKFWEHLLARTCDRYGARIHGYTWLPNESILVLQRFAVPLDVMLASILGQYSRYLHRVGKVERGRSPYMSRYQSIEVTSGVLPYAVRHLYWQGFKAGLCASALEYPFCSYRLHYAPEVPPWFERSDFVAALEQRGYVGRSGAERFLSKPESPRHVALFESRSGRKPQIVGETADVEEARWRAKYAPRAPSLSQVINAVAAMLHRDANELGESVLGKSLTTWYATRGGIATLEEMGRWFDCAPTTLRRDIESHRRTSPTLFEFSLEELLALARDVMSESITTGAPVQESISNAGPGSAASDEHHVADEAHPPLGWH